MAKAKTPWTTVSLRPLTGPLDVRSRPADIPPGAFRWKQNSSVSTEGKLGRAEGFQRAWPDMLYDNNGVLLTVPGDHDGIVYHNHDHHHQGATREAITFQFESTDANGVRRYFDGTQSRVSLLDEPTGYYTDIITGKGAAGSRWRGAQSQDILVLTNDVDDVQFYDIETPGVSTSTDLINVLQVRKAKIVVEYNGFIILMNMEQAGKRYSTRVRWSDLNLPKVFDPGAANSLANFQDLDYGDEILNAGFLLGNLYIFTRRSIWRASVSGVTAGTFTFLRVYNEPKNQTGCLAYPNTLTSDGESFRYLGRDSIYKFNPYIAAPIREDWSHLASGVIFSKADTRMNGTNCDAPVAEYRPEVTEMWISWPAGSAALNTHTLVLQTKFETADIRDHGFTSFLNYRKTPILSLCNERQSFLGVSATDLSIKDIGQGVYSRELLIMEGAQSDDPALNSAPALYETVGYNTILRGQIPTGFIDREKIIRAVNVDHDTSQADVPVVMRCRIGNTRNLHDPNDTDNICAVLWEDLDTISLACIDADTVSAMRAQNIRPDVPTGWTCYITGYFLYFEFKIENEDGTPAIGGDTALQRLDFDMLALPKP